MNYNVVPLNGGSQFDLNGVRFDGKSFMFWKKKGQPITEIVVIFNKKYENISVRDGVAILSLKGLMNYSDLKEAIQIFKKIIGDSKIQFSFIVGNENEQKVAEALGSELGIAYTIQNINQVVNQTKVMEEEIKNQELSAGNSQMIEKYDYGVLKQISVDKNKGIAYENNGLLNSEEEKISLLHQWMQDPVMAEKLSRMSVEARNELLTQSVMANRTENRLEKASEQRANDTVGEMAVNKAIREDGLVNTTLGIIQNNASNLNQYSVVEKDGENVQLVNAEVRKSMINTSGISSVSGTSESTVDSYQGNVQTHELEGQSKQLETILYFDEEYNILNEEGEKIGKLYQGGYEYDSNNNSILKNGQVIGYVGDYKNMERSNSNVYKKPKIHTLKKPEREKSAAFVSLPVIIFILSAILLIVSAVLLFVVD